MKIGIIVAMGKELALLLPLISDCTERQGAYYGKMAGKEVCVVQCGIGKVNAALTTDRLLREFKPDIVINTGVAGGADLSMHVLDILVATQVSYHDVWCGPGTVWGEASGCPARMECDSAVTKAALKSAESSSNVHYGLICSGDIFVSTVEETSLIKSHFPDALAVDMESGAIAQTCTLRHTPFAVIRVISDTPGAAENISQYENFWSDAPAETFAMLTRIIELL